MLSADLSIRTFLAPDKGIGGSMSTAKQLVNLPNLDDLRSQYKGYYGITSGGPNLLPAIKALPVEKLDKMMDALRAMGPENKVFVMGNGGSYDNARLLIKLFQKVGLNSKSPGNPDWYFNGNYDQIFARGLAEDKIGKGDVVIGLSGSGNSPNILEAFTTGKNNGAHVFALGGRDGGKMRNIAGDEASVVAASENMEAIEDVHYVAGIILAEAYQTDRSVADVKSDFISRMERCVTSDNLSKLSQLASHLIRTIENESFAFIVGSGISTAHFRADAQRGFTNALPIRGLNTPELFTINSGMATANDDGSDFLIIDGLSKFNAGPDDFALLMDLPGTEAQIALAREWLERRNVPYMSVGSTPESINFAPLLNSIDPEFVPSHIGHGTGVALRGTLWQSWSVRELQGVEKTIDFKGQRKLSANDAELLRADLIQQGIIAHNEVPTFCYGKVFAALNPSQFGKEWTHY